MNFYIGISIGLLLGSLLGAYGMGVAICWALKQKEIIQKIISDVYHVDLMPEICRIEGTINVALMESLNNIPSARQFMLMALEAAQRLKDNVSKIITKYHEHS